MGGRVELSCDLKKWKITAAVVAYVASRTGYTIPKIEFKVSGQKDFFG
jgi:hypothetical protein